MGYHADVQKLSYGINSPREVYDGCCYSEHAEVAAIKRLKPHKSKRKKKVSLMVIRVTRSGKLCNSKPCAKCIQYLATMKYYTVKDVYYSDETGQIVVVKLSKLLNDRNKHVSSRFRRKVSS